MLLSRNVVVSEWRCDGIAMCPNGDKSGYVLLCYVIYGGEQSDDLLSWLTWSLDKMQLSEPAVSHRYS